MSVDANVFAYSDFILQELGTDAAAACGGLVPVGSDGVTVTPQSGTLDSGTTTGSLNVTVTDEVDVVRVALNAEDRPDFDVDLFVKQGPGVSETDFDCKADGEGVFGACELASSSVAEWSVLVRRVTGTGEYQVTTTAFPSVDLPPALSCQDSCGGFAGACWCDEACTQYGDCC